MVTQAGHDALALEVKFLRQDVRRLQDRMEALERERGPRPAGGDGVPRAPSDSRAAAPTRR